MSQTVARRVLEVRRLGTVGYPEALAMQRALVSTAVGVAGLGLASGENVLLADQPEPFADSIVSLLKNAPLAEALALRGRKFVEQRYGWKRLAEKMLAVWEELS